MRPGTGGNPQGDGNRRRYPVHQLYHGEFHYESRKPLGLFIHRDKGKFIGIDNRHGDAWTEEFTTQKGCLKWLAGEMPREAIKE